MIIKELRHNQLCSFFPKNLQFCPFLGDFTPILLSIRLWEWEGPDAIRHPRKKSRHVRSRDDGRAQPRPARSTPGEAGRAANRQAFASPSYPANRQVLRNPHVGRPGFLISTGFLISMSHHPRTAVRLGRHAGLLLTPNCQRWSARSRHT